MRPHWLREAEHRDRPERWRQAREAVARAAFCGAVVVYSPLLVISCAPGAAAPILAAVAAVSSLGLVSAKWKRKLLALGMTSLFALWAWTDWDLGAACRQNLYGSPSASRSGPPASVHETTSSAAPSP